MYRKKIENTVIRSIKLMKPLQLCTIFCENLVVKSYFANFLEQIDTPKRM